MGIRTYLPREGTEIIAKLQELNRLFCIRTYLPREGPETKIAPEASIVLACCIRTYPPREGTETHVFRLC